MFFNPPSLTKPIDNAFSQIITLERQVRHATDDYSVALQDLPTQAARYNVFFKLIEINEAFGAVRAAGFNEAADALVSVIGNKFHAYDNAWREYLHALFAECPFLADKKDSFNKMMDAEEKAYEAIRDAAPDTDEEAA